MTRKALVVLIILSALSFFDIIIFKNAIITLAQFASTGIILFLLLYHFTYDNGFRMKMLFKTEITLLLISVALSMFGARMFHGQSFLQTAQAQSQLYFFFLYFFLSYLKIHPEDIIRLFFFIGFVFMGVYFAQFFLYPTKIVSSSIMEERGTLRMAIPGGGFSFFMYFMSLSLFFRTKKIKYILLLLALLTVFILMGSRQLIAVLVGTTMAFILINKEVKSKFIIIAVAAILMVSIYMAFEQVFSSLFELSKSQGETYEDNVRLKAAQFFLFNFSPNTLAQIIGNGAANPHSGYGSQVIYYMQNFGYFQADIGILGEYTKYGLLYTLAELFIIFKVIFMKLPPIISFIRFMWMGKLLMGFTGGGVFSEAPNIVEICLVLYIIDAYKTIEFKNLRNETAKPVYINPGL